MEKKVVDLSSFCENYNHLISHERLLRMGCDVITFTVRCLRDIFEVIGVVKHLTTDERLKTKWYTIKIDPDCIIQKDEYDFLNREMKSMLTSFEIEGKIYKNEEEIQKEYKKRIYNYINEFFRISFNGFDDPFMIDQFYREGVSHSVFGGYMPSSYLKGFSDFLYKIDFLNSIFPKYIIHTRLYKEIKSDIEKIENRALSGEIENLEEELFLYMHEKYRTLEWVGRYMVGSVSDDSENVSIVRKFVYSFLSSNKNK